jgi:hypothetical protein
MKKLMYGFIISCLVILQNLAIDTRNAMPKDVKDMQQQFTPVGDSVDDESLKQVEYEARNSIRLLQKFIHTLCEYEIKSLHEREKLIQDFYQNMVGNAFDALPANDSAKHDSEK